MANGRETGGKSKAGIRAAHQALAVSSPGPAAEATPQEVAEYIASMLDGLKTLAKNSQLTFLAYLIGVAIEEANDQKSRRD